MIVFTIVLNVFLLFKLIIAQEQNFVLKPSDTNVVLGDTVVLKCSVTPSKHGDVQWIHNGTALGYDRKVPGKPRYTVIYNDNEDQEYHLQIVNVTLDDEGTYACQVAPIGDWDTKLEAKAKLTVLIAPISKPEIIFNDETKYNDDIVHIKESAIKTSKFSCRARKSKPVAQIKWFLNGTQITSSLATIKDEVSKDAYLDDIISTLEFKATTQFNNSLIKCQVYHLAYGSLTTELANMSASLRLVIVYPPSQPQLSGYDSSTGVIAGSNMNLVCTSQHRYPPARLTWYRDKKLLKTSYDTIDSKTESEVKFKVDASDNQIIYKCDAINQAIDQPLTSEVKLNVLFGPTNILLTGQFEAKLNEQIIAICTSDSSNPVPKISFIFDNIPYEPYQQTSSASVNFGTIVNATFIRNVTREDNDKEVRCLVENKAANIQKTISKSIKVLYPPESVTIIYSEENKTINEGEKIRMACVVRGGNPNVDVEWFIGGVALLPRTKVNALSTQSFMFATESTIELTLKREYHNQPIECVATNKVATVKKAVTLSVAYLSSAVKITQIEPAASLIKAGSKVILACVSSNSFPEAEIKWFKDSYAISFDNDNTKMNTTAKLLNDYETTSYVEFIATSSDHNKEVRCDVNVKSIQRTMHATLILSVAFAPEIIKSPPSVIDVTENTNFVLNLTARSNPEAKYSCTASNGKTYIVENSILKFNASKQDNAEFKCLLTNSEKATEVKFRLNVKYSASAIANNSLYTVSKGDSANLFCIVSGNPLELSNIEWKLNAKSLSSSDQRYQSRLESNGVAVLNIMNVKEIDDGNFTCNVNNKIGAQSSASMRLLVKRSPVIMDDSVLKAAEDSNKGRSVRFICRAQAHPDVTFKWKFSNNVEITNTSKHTILNTRVENTQIYMSTLIIQVVVSSDYGTYICEAKNEIGTQIGKAFLSGKHQPEKPSEFRVTNITRNSISLAWKKNFDGGDPQRFRIRYRKDTLDPTYKYVETDSDQSSVILDNLEMATRYIINIQSLNEFGTDGYLSEPLMVQTDFGFNDVNQLPIYTGNDLPLTIILIVCGVGTLLLLFNVILIIYFIRKRKKKSETDSTTGTNETDANTVEMFTPPPPYPDELNYQLDLSPNLYEDENKPFVPQTIKYIKKLPNTDNEYSVEYATPMQSWNDAANNELLNDELYVASYRDFKSTDPFMRVRAYPYETIGNHSNIRLGDIEKLTIKPSNSHNATNCLYSSTNHQPKIYQSLDEFKGHLV